MKATRKFRKVDFEHAISQVRKGVMSVKDVAMSFGIAEQEISCNSIDNEIRLLSKEEERTLLQHVVKMSQLGQPRSYLQLRYLAGSMAFSAGKKQSTGPLSIYWLIGFLARKDACSFLKFR